jgi:hypothetical protein
MTVFKDNFKFENGDLMFNVYCVLGSDHVCKSFYIFYTNNLMVKYNKAEKVINLI